MFEQLKISTPGHKPKKNCLSSFAIHHDRQYHVFHKSFLKRECKLYNPFFIPRDMLCYLSPKLPWQEGALHLSGSLCKTEASATKQPNKEIQTCRLSLPGASFHLLSGITMVHWAHFGVGPSPWFPRFAWLSTRQQPPFPHPSTSS